MTDVMNLKLLKRSCEYSDYNLYYNVYYQFRKIMKQMSYCLSGHARRTPLLFACTRVNVRYDNEDVKLIIGT